MKRLSFLFLLSLLLFAMGAEAKRYRVLRFNDTNILVNGHPIKQREVFNEKAVITWQRPEKRQFMALLCLDDGHQYYLVSKPTEIGGNTVDKLLTNNIHASTQDPIATARPDSMLLRQRDAIFTEYYMIDDTIRIKQCLEADDEHYFVASFDYGDTYLTKRLPCANGEIIISAKNIFSVNDVALKPCDIVLDINYYSNNMPTYVKGDIRVLIVPEKLE